MMARRWPAAAFVAAWTCVIVLGVMALPDDGYGRAGRGQSYRSSSSSSRSSSYRSSSSSRSYRSSSSRSSSYGGSSSRSYRSSGSTYRHYPSSTRHSSGSNATRDIIIGFIVMGVLIAVFVIIVVFVVRYIRLKGRTMTLLNASAPPPSDRTEEIVAAVRRDDPEFSLEEFQRRAAEIFQRLQAAWSAGDMSPVRNYLSQGVYNRYRIQLEIMRDVEGVKNVMSDINVSRTGLAAFDDAGAYQTLHVTVYASARDVTVPAGASDDETSRALAAAPVSPFTEIYSFTRKRGARTDAAKDWLKGQCPNCGFVPDNFSQVNKCPSCGSIYNSGEYDWVLSEITQSGEWHGGSAADVPGLAELGAANLSMNRQVVEDRASYLFWRWIQSRVRGSAAPLARDAVADYKSAFNVASREYLGEIAVGAVDLKSIDIESGRARTEAQVLWSASSAQGAEPRHHEHTLRLGMSAATENRFGLADHGCGKCGAPLPETDALACAYCGAPLPEVNEDWLLEGINGN